MVSGARIAVLLAWTSAVGCGRVDYAVDGGSAARDTGSMDAGPFDAGPFDAGSTVDAGADAGRLPPCDWSDPRFEPPTLVSASVTDPYALSLSPDGLTVYFTLDGAVQSASRPALDRPFGPHARLDSVFDAAYRVDGVTFRRDGLELVMASEGLGGAGLADLFHRVRARPEDPWPPPVPLAVLNTADFDWDYFLEPDGLTLWFQRQTLDPTSPDVFRAVRAAPDAPFGPGVAVPNLSAPGTPESAPTLPDDRAVVVASVGQDIQFARMVAGSPGPPIPLPELNSAEVEYEPTVRSDGCEILFVSNRDGTMRMYQSRRAP